MPLASSRSLFFLAFLGCAALLGMGLYLQYAVGLEPCPLCIVQRVFFIAFGLLCLVAGLHAPARGGRLAYAVGGLLLASGGAATAGRQVWLQSMPADQLPACLPSLEYMMEALPFQDIVALVLHGSADCAEVSWTFLSLSIAEWSLLAFAGLLVFSVFQLLRRGD
jgi:disulfide bond formation protein DsbB